MENLNPLLYVTDWTPVPETILDASGWFETETASVKVYDDTEFSVGWLLAQGWTVTGTNFGTDQVPSLNSNYAVIGYFSKTYTVYSLKRRKLQGERVLQAMINSFTNAYNEGRVLNDRRYDEILTIYSAINSDSVAEMNAIATTGETYDAIVDAVIAALPTDFAEYKADVEDLLDDYGVSHRERVNTQFDNQIAAARADLISRGMYNGTVWTSVNSGIEQDRATALNDLEDKILDRTLVAVDRIQAARISMRSGVESAANRLSEIKRTRDLGMLEFRNAIITAMAKVIEDRDDDYPGIGELAKLAAGLGYGDGSSVRPG